MSRPPKPRYVVTLDVLPDAVPGPIRLRTFLKSALRSCRLRAIEVREVPAPRPNAEKIVDQDADASTGT
jgi:hypothetical protein